MRLINLFVFVLFCCSLSAQDKMFDPVKWSFETKHVSGDEYDLIMHAKIADGWNMYSQFIEEGGPVPTSFTFDESDHFSLVGPVKESKNAKTLRDKIFEMKVIKFYKYADFTQRVKIKDPSKEVTGYLTFMTCDNIRCLAPKDIDLSFDLSVVPKKNSGSNSGENKADGASNLSSEENGIADNEQASTQNNNLTETNQNSSKEVNNSSKEVNKKVAHQDLDRGSNKETVERKQEKEEIAPSEPSSSSFGSVDLGGLDESNSNFGGNSKMDNPVQWSYSIKEVEKGIYDLIWKADIRDEWHIYSQFIEDADIRPEPTTFYLDSMDAYTYQGSIKEESSKRIEGKDPLFDNINVIKLKHDATFTQRVQANDAKAIVHGEIVYMTCNSEKCIMGAPIEFSFDLAKLKAGEGNWTDAGNSEVENAIAAGNVIDNAIPTIQETYETPIGDCGEEVTSRNKSLFWTFLLGFGGGLLALLTPCVFPMIPLTVSFFTKDTKRKGWMNGAIYGLSIIVIYVALGLLITGIFGASALNSLSTSWIANTIFFVIFLFFAFSFFGFYEIQLPSSLANKSDSMADKGGLIGIFFMAFTLAIVSFSCTGPIIGTALVESATSKIGPAVVMFGFSLALALPFGLFAAFPSWLNSLPRSGGWMNSVKVMLGFAELALAFKFLSVADMTSHWGILRYEPFMIIWVMVAIGMSLYMFGLIKFPHDSPVKKLNVTRWVLGLGMAGVAVYLASGFLYNDKTKTYNSLSAMSGLAPPANYNFFLPEPMLDQSLASRFPSFTKCANNLDCFHDYYEGVEYAKEVNKPILLDFTGYGCVNCRKTEEHIWVRDNVREKIDEDFVLISLYVDDKEPLEEIKISANNNSKLRTVGRIWGDFQEVNFQQNSQPLYVLMSPEEKVLAKPRGYVDDVKGYADFLSCGLQTFERQGELMMQK